MERRSVEDAASRCFEGYGILGMSVEATIGVSIIEACRSSARLARCPRLRLSTFGRQRAAGFPLVATFDRPHYTLTLPDLSEITLARLDRAFDKPIPNPGRPVPG